MKVVRGNGDDLSRARSVGLMLGHILATVGALLPIAAFGAAPLLQSYCMGLGALTLLVAQGYTYDRPMRTVAAWGMTTPIVHIILSIFGAPVWDLQTVLFAMLLSAMSTTPIWTVVAATTMSTTAGSSFLVARRLFAFCSPVSRYETIALVPGLFAACGAYAGAWFLPLDWYSIWQQWPLPCATAAVVFYIAGCVAAIGLCLFKSFDAAAASKLSA
eukprot:ANDGO_02157.mRNA.1 hypothetical protein SPRG_19082